MLAPPAASQGFGGFAARGPAPSRGSPAADLASLGGMLDAPADDSLLSLTFSDGSYPRAASYLAARDIQGGYVYWDNGPDGTFGEDDEPSGGGTTTTTTVDVHDPLGLDAATINALGQALFGGIVYDGFENPIGGGQAPSYPQPQQDGGIRDPTGLNTDSTGNQINNPGTGSDVEGDDLLGPNGEVLMYRPFLNGVNKLAKAGQVAGNIAGAFNPLVNAVTAISGRNPDGSCASTWERIAAGTAAAGAIPGEVVAAVSGRIAELIDAARTSRNAARFRAAMIDAGESLGAGDAAHHIVASTDAKAAASRAILQREGIGNNDAVNGVGLPKNGSVPSPSMTVHSTMHTNVFHNAVYEELRDAPQGSVRDVLRSIALRLQRGQFPF